MDVETIEAPLEEITLHPLNYFHFELSCKKKKGALKKAAYAVPSFAEMHGEKECSTLYFAWSEEGLHFHLDSDVKMGESHFPDYDLGEALELFIDTRDIKNKTFNHRFCHQFVFLPEAVSGVQAKEVTRFRTEDLHPLAEASLLEVVSYKKKKGYEMEIFIPKEALFGYDPAEFNRMGFCFVQHFSDHSPVEMTLLQKEIQIDQNPSVWSSVKFVS